MARAISGTLPEAFLILPEPANMRPRPQDAGRSPLVLLDEVAPHLDSDRRTVLFAAPLKPGAQSWMPGSGDEQFAERRDEARFPNDFEIGGSMFVTRVLVGS